MKHKKFIIAASALLLLSPTFASELSKNKNVMNDEAVSVEVTAKEKEKVEKIKKIFNITGDYKSFTISKDPLDSDTGNKYLDKLVKGKYIEMYRWSDENLGAIDIFYNSDGEFISYNKWTNDGEQDKKVIAKDEAQKMAEDLLKNLIKDFDKKYTLSNYEVFRGSGDINITYQRIVNGIPLADTFISVNIDSRYGQVNNIYSMGANSYAYSFLKDSDFKKDNEISLEDAKIIFLEKSPLILSYKINERNESVEKVYHTKVADIDAKTGEIVKEKTNMDFMPYAKAEAAMDSSGLTETEIKKIDGLKNIKSKSEAKKMAMEIVGKDFEIANIALYSDDDNYYYRMTLEKEKNYGNIVLNAKNLKLVNFDIWSDKKDSENKVKEEDAIKTAKSFLEKYGDKSELNLEKITVEKSDLGTNIFFPRYVNKIPVIDEGAKIFVNGNNVVTTYDKNSSKHDFDKAENIDFTMEEANQIYLNSKNFGLKYEITDNGPRLLYGTIKRIEPIIGKDKILRDSFGEIVNFKEQINYEDFDQAKNKEALNSLKEMGIGLIGKNLSDKVTYKEFYSLIAEDYGKDPYYKSRFGIDYKALKDKNITEKDIVKSLVINNELEKFTKAKNIFKDDLFKNQKSLGDYEKYYIVARGFGYIDSEINPDEEPSLEEILYLIYNSIK